MELSRISVRDDHSDNDEGDDCDDAVEAYPKFFKTRMLRLRWLC